MSHSVRGALRPWLPSVAFVAAALLPLTADAAEPPRLERTAVPAAGRAATRLEVFEAGRYAISVESRQGVSLRVVDRMSGTGALSGAPGERDGRVDLFLDRGEVRLLTEGAELGRGEARLVVRPFEERHRPAPRLAELRPVDGELGDFEQLSWWLEVPERRRVVLHAAGRHLADLRLWQNGTWLVDARPEISTAEPTPGRPLALARLSADLGPGLYLLSAYGGPARPWSAPGAERPFHLLWGDEVRGAAARERRVMGPLGFQRLRIPASADIVRAELAEPGVLTLECAELEEDAPFPPPREIAGISKESLPPVAELRREAGPADRSLLVTVRAAPGTAYVLQHLTAARRIPIPGRGPHWLGSVHAGPAADSIDATGILVAVRDGGRGRAEPVAAAVPVLDRGRLWSRRFNLLAPATLFFRVDAAGDYALSAAGSAAEFRVEPFLLEPPDGYRPPPARRAPATFALEPGFFVLTLTPLDPGVVSVGLRPAGLADPLAGGAAPAAPPLAAAVTLGRVALEPRTSYELWLNDQPGVTAGGVVRELPLDLSEPLPLALAPGEVIELPFRATARGALAGSDEHGAPLELSLDGTFWSAGLDVPAGVGAVRVRSTAAASVAGTVAFVADERRAVVPLPPLPAETLARRPVFERLEPGRPHPFDLERQAARTFEVSAPEAGLYVVETTGLLATAADLRTAVAPRLAASTGGGTGRNAAVRAYLRAGDYQVTVRARGESAGHLEVALRRAALRPGGTLPLDLPARAALAADEAIAYDLEIAAAGEYRLLCLGHGGPVAGRLEDAGGWPVGPPVVAGDVRLPLQPGRYRWIVLPRAVPARVVTRIERLVTAPPRPGHGPHELALDRAVAHVWREPEEGGERDPDRWRFRLPAGARVRVELDGEMEGEIVAAAAGGPAAALVRPGRGFEGELPAGDWELRVRCSRIDNRVPYELRVSTSELVEGLARRLALPAIVPVAIGADAQVEIDSFGAADVRARLFDARGTLLASADDRPGDWNFLIARRLAAGRYRLEVEPVAGARGAATTVALRVRAERESAPLPLPARTGLRLGAEVLLVPLETRGAAGLLAAGAVGDRALGFELERERGGVWSTVDAARGTVLRLLAPLPDESGGWRLRLWSLDGVPAEVALSGFAGPPPEVGEEELERAVELSALPAFEPPTAALVARLDRPGCFRLAGPDATAPELLSAPRAGLAFAPVAGLATALEPALWLAAPLAPGAAPVVAARRVRLADGPPPLVLTLRPGERPRCDVEPAAAPVAVLADALAGAPVVAAGGIGATALAEHRALALLPAGAGAAAELRSDGPAALETEVSARRLEPAPARDGRAGELEVELAPRTLVPVALPGGPKRLRLTLGAGAAAAVGVLAAPESTHWAARREEAYGLWSTAAEVSLFNPGDAPARARVAWTYEPAPPALAPAAPFERRFARAETLRIALGPGAPAGARLLVRGARSATLVSTDGAVASGDDLPVPAAGGALLVEAGPGFVAAWLAGATDPQAPFGFGPPPPARDLAAPATLALEGREAAFRLAGATEPALLSLRSATPMAVALEPAAGASGAARFELYPGAVSFDALLPAGGALLRLRALGGERLGAAAELAVRPLEPLAEGLGAATLLAPGDARGFRFEVDRSGPVGVAVAGGGPGVEAIAFDAGGRPLGRGVAQWLDLAPGRYVLALVCAADSAPVAARPALVGAAAPGTGPPPEIVRGFFELERGAPAVAAGVAGAESPRRFDPARMPTGQEEPVEEDWEESEEEEEEEPGGEQWQESADGDESGDDAELDDGEWPESGPDAEETGDRGEPRDLGEGGEGR